MAAIVSIHFFVFVLAEDQKASWVVLSWNARFILCCVMSLSLVADSSVTMSSFLLVFSAVLAKSGLFALWNLHQSCLPLFGRILRPCLRALLVMWNGPGLLCLARYFLSLFSLRPGVGLSLDSHTRLPWRWRRQLEGRHISWMEEQPFWSLGNQVVDQLGTAYAQLASVFSQTRHTTLNRKITVLALSLSHWLENILFYPLGTEQTLSLVNSLGAFSSQSSV